MKGFILLKNKFKKNEIEVALSCVVLLFLWQIIAIKINNDIYLPTINQTLESLHEILSQKRFYLDIIFSTGRSIISFIVALTFATVIGILAYISTIIRNFFKPLNTLANSIPMMIVILLALIWFDKNNAPFIVGFMITFPILYENILGSMIELDKSLIEMANVYKVSLKDKIIKIYFPAIKFRLTPIIASTISLALKVVIAGEVYGQPSYGIGTMIQVEKINFNTSGIFAWLIIIILISVFISIIQNKISRSTFTWKR
jgi:NitT/TauT family transport system permease protein